MQFVPTENFEYSVTDETGQTRLVASYVAGHTYSCRTPQMEAKAEGWAAKGKVTIINAPARPVMNEQPEV